MIRLCTIGLLVNLKNRAGMTGENQWIRNNKRMRTPLFTLWDSINRQITFIPLLKIIIDGARKESISQNFLRDTNFDEKFRHIYNLSNDNINSKKLILVNQELERFEMTESPV